MPKKTDEETRQKIAQALRDGKSTNQAADLCGVSWNTANEVRKEIGVAPVSQGRPASGTAQARPNRKPGAAARKPGPAPKPSAPARATSVELTIRQAVVVECPGCACGITLDGPALDRLRAKVS